ncbi:MAG: type II toxin-antitoxin system RelE/ParE family toxin [Pleurocapsa minor HA4230-MV1]|jgi:mRNA interferase RelE/StbE|nr:type II toxin-antitoxin system RelE/ParE family toxin [Pleurocapsa minor HA4230-MV1]
MQYRIEITPLAIELLSKIKDKREQQGLKQRIEKLTSEPEKQGKALSRKLKEYRSVRALGQRYRIVYRVDRSTITVLIVGAGIRKEGAKKDIYAILNKFFS